MYVLSNETEVLEMCRCFQCLLWEILRVWLTKTSLGFMVWRSHKNKARFIKPRRYQDEAAKPPVYSKYIWR